MGREGHHGTSRGSHRTVLLWTDSSRLLVICVITTPHITVVVRSWDPSLTSGVMVFGLGMFMLRMLVWSQYCYGSCAFDWVSIILVYSRCDEAYVCCMHGSS